MKNINENLVNYVKNDLIIQGENVIIFKDLKVYKYQ